MKFLVEVDDYFLWSLWVDSHGERKSFRWDLKTQVKAIGRPLKSNGFHSLEPSIEKSSPFLSFVTGGTRHSCSGDHYAIKESCSFSEGCYPFSQYLIISKKLRIHWGAKHPCFPVPSTSTFSHDHVPAQYTCPGINWGFIMTLSRSCTSTGR